MVGARDVVPMPKMGERAVLRQEARRRGRLGLTPDNGAFSAGPERFR